MLAGSNKVARPSGLGHNLNLVHPGNLFGLMGKGEGVDESRVELTKNRLILGQFYFTLLPHQSKRTIGFKR